MKTDRKQFCVKLLEQDDAWEDLGEGPSDNQRCRRSIEQIGQIYKGLEWQWEIDKAIERDLERAQAAVRDTEEGSNGKGSFLEGSSGNERRRRRFERLLNQKCKKKCSKWC